MQLMTGPHYFHLLPFTIPAVRVVLGERWLPCMMNSAVALCNKLLDVQSRAPAGATRLDLPMFVVVGAQSSGKSSVLDNIIGRSFLPRGSGTVTRRPLNLMMQRCDEEYVEFGHLPGERFTQDADMCAARPKSRRSLSLCFCILRCGSAVAPFGSALARARAACAMTLGWLTLAPGRPRVARSARAIEEATLSECGPTGFSSRPISLTYYSPEVTELALVDLPGVIQTAAEDMDARAPEKIRSMVTEFATRRNAILLAVTPATEDIVNSMAIRIARECDPRQERTLGVITKLDLMDDGTDCAKALRNEDSRAPKLRLGYVGVVNRGQADINKGMDLNGARAREEQWFAAPQQAAYREGATRLGTKALIATSSQLLEEHVARCLPEIRKVISETLRDRSARLEELEKKADPQGLLDQMRTGIDEAKKSFLAALTPSAVFSLVGGVIDGELDDEKGLHDLNDAGAKLDELFNEMQKQLVFSVRTYYPNQLLKIRDQLGGLEDPMGDIGPTFRFLVAQQIPAFRPHVEQVATKAVDVLKNVISTLSIPSIKEYVELETELKQQCMRWLNENEAPTKLLCLNLVEMEEARINTAHPKFCARPEERLTFDESCEQLAKLSVTMKVVMPEVVLEADVHKTKLGNMKGGAKARRLVLLRSGMLVWYIRNCKTGNDARGRCQLSGCTVTVEASSKRAILHLSGGSLKGQGYRFVFTSVELAHRWEGHLNGVIADLAVEHAARVEKTKTRERAITRKLFSTKNPKLDEPLDTALHVVHLQRDNAAEHGFEPPKTKKKSRGTQDLAGATPGWVFRAECAGFTYVGAAATVNNVVQITASNAADHNFERGSLPAAAEKEASMDMSGPIPGVAYHVPHAGYRFLGTPSGTHTDTDGHLDAWLTSQQLGSSDELERLTDFEEDKRKMYYQITRMLSSYNRIVQEQLQDTVPKAIMARLVAATRDAIDKNLGFDDLRAAVHEYMEGAGAANIKKELEVLRAEVAYLKESESVLLHTSATLRDVTPVVYESGPVTVHREADNGLNKVTSLQCSCSASALSEANSSPQCVGASPATYRTETSECYLKQQGAAASAASQYVEKKLGASPPVKKRSIPNVISPNERNSLVSAGL